MSHKKVTQKNRILKFGFYMTVYSNLKWITPDQKYQARVDQLILRPGLRHVRHR